MRAQLPAWSKFEISLLCQLAAQHKSSFQISKALGTRTPSAVRRRAHILGIKLRRADVPEPPRNPDASSWTEAEKICAWASVPIELAELLTARAEEAGIPLHRARSESREKELVKFRKSFAKEAFTKNFGYSQIGRALNRDHTTIIYAVLSTENRVIANSSHNHGPQDSMVAA